jgi:hypothetical protein
MSDLIYCTALYLPGIDIIVMLLLLCYPCTGVILFIFQNSKWRGFFFYYALVQDNKGRHFLYVAHNYTERKRCFLSIITCCMLCTGITVILYVAKKR